MSEIIILGLAGRAGSGKTTVAKYLQRQYGLLPVSLAQPLKALVQDLWGFSCLQVNGTQAQKEEIDPRWGVSPRQCMERLGNGARKHLYEGIWADACMRLIKAKILEGHRKFVIEDVRYPNEAVIIRTQLNYTTGIIKLVCPDAQTLADPNGATEVNVDRIRQDLLTDTITSRRADCDLISKVESLIYSSQADIFKQMRLYSLSNSHESLAVSMPTLDTPSDT